MKMLELLERYGIKTRRVDHRSEGKGGRTPSCRQCYAGDKMPAYQHSTYFIDKNPMVEAWAEFLGQPYEKWSAEHMDFFCMVHYLQFVLADCKETLELVHEYVNPMCHP